MFDLASLIIAGLLFVGILIGGAAQGAFEQGDIKPSLILGSISALCFGFALWIALG